MRFDALQNFEWLNEPSEIFLTNGMKVVANPQTDFWQSYREDFHKDNGHLFYVCKDNDFEINLKWSFLSLPAFSQCGLMVRVDEFNWFKLSVMSQNGEDCFIASSVTNFGTSDLAGHGIIKRPDIVHYRLKLKDGGFRAYYSLNGIEFIEVRSFDLLKETPDYLVGPYICSPSASRFSAMLEDVEIL